MKTDEATLTESQFHKKMAAELFNETWKLLDKPNRTPEEDASMSHAAHASRWHWQFVGSARNLAIGEWQVARVHAVLQQFDAALYHAQRSLDLAVLHHLGPFSVACGYEAMARALAVAQPQTALQHIAIARSLASEITDPEDRQILTEDLASIRV